MGLEIPASRLSVLSAILAFGVLACVIWLPDLTLLAALVSALVAVLALFTAPTSSQGTSASDAASGRELLGHDAYEIVDKVSEGGMGEVFRARQLELGRLVALKRIKPKRLTAEEQARFRREARVLSGLSNPHTINVFDAGIQQGGMLFYVMELLDGLNLRQLVHRQGPVVPARVIHILSQATLSLLEAHEQDFVHRDLNPSNLMVCRYGGDFDFVKVLDFGLVKSMNPDQPAEGAYVTQAGEVPGTPAFLAPEAISASGPPTASSDIYALGAIGHFLLTGTLLFEAESPIAMARAQLHEVPPRASEKSPHDVPKELDDLIASCLAKAPTDRPRSAKVLLERLHALSIAHPWSRAQAEAAWSDVPAQAVRPSNHPLLPSESTARGAAASQAGTDSV